MLFPCRNVVDQLLLILIISYHNYVVLVHQQAIGRIVCALITPIP